jgi:KipI family sensor histidine kinase inhibitor
MLYTLSLMRIAPASDSSIFIGFGDAISFEHHAQVVGLFRRVSALDHPYIRNLHPAYSSLLIDFDPLCITYDAMRELVMSLLAKPSAYEAADFNLVDIPVCYDAAFALDLEFVAEHAKLTPEQVIAAHLAGTYLVYFLGFSPGFAYLGPIAPQLEVPRLPSPRRRVNSGSVALAGQQTGVYPSDSPGGWRIIGRTPLRMFDSAAAQPSRLQPGDQVRFRRITRDEFVALAAEEHSR